MDRKALIARVEKTTNGFTDIQRAAEEIMADTSIADKVGLAHELFGSEVNQARMLAVFVFGYASPSQPEILHFLRQTVSLDADWRVQEILAKAFDQFCAGVGYEAALPAIRAWLDDPSPNVRRAVTEGLRIWTSRPYFKDHPEEAIALIAAHYADPSEYLRKSVGNSLRDISRKYPELVRAEIGRWDMTQKPAALTARLAGKFLG